MRNEILESIQKMIQALVDAPVEIGSIPPINGFAVGFAGGAPLETFRNLDTNEDMPIVFNGKGPDQQLLANSMDTVHAALTTSKALPHSSDWQIYAILTTSAPQLIMREENTNWVYGSSFKIKFYAKGIQNA